MQIFGSSGNAVFSLGVDSKVDFRENGFEKGTSGRLLCHNPLEKEANFYRTIRRKSCDLLLPTPVLLLLNSLQNAT